MDSATEKEIVLEVKNLSITIDSEELLQGVTFSLRKGEALAIIGPNGAGKTVLVRSLLGLLPYHGTIAWQKGIKIGYVPQKFFVDRSIPITVQEFFLLKSSYFWSPQKNFLEHLYHELALVGLGDEVLNRPISELSGGQFQRIMISWAMLNHPDVLLFDEPTSGIDIGAEETIYNLIHRLQDERGTTVILVSHDLNIVYRYAENVLCINKRMVCHGPPSEVLSPAELAQLYGAGGFYHHIENGHH